MPWYFYGKTSNLVGPIAPGALYPGSIILSVLPYTSTEPDGFLFCNGQSVLKNDYIDLFSEIGTEFGSININEFNVPDFRGRIPRGITNYAGGFGSPLGVGGSKTHTHTVNGHSHTVSDNHTHSISTHSHTTPNHLHQMLNHIHPASANFIIHPAANPGVNSDTEESGVNPRVQCIADNLGMHDHGGQVAGWTGLTGEAGNNTSSNGSGNTDSLSRATDPFNLTGSTSSSGGGTSSSGSNIPPYFTVSFLIKT